MLSLKEEREHVDFDQQELNQIIYNIPSEKAFIEKLNDKFSTDPGLVHHRYETELNRGELVTQNYKRLARY